MSEKQVAVINISKILKDVSLPTIAAIGSATGNIWIAGAAAIPAAIAASGTLKSLFEKKKEEYLELPVPRWWTDNNAQSWQRACSSIENCLPTVMENVAKRLQQEQAIPTTLLLRQTFSDELARQISVWDITLQYRGLLAEYVTPSILQKSAAALQAVIDPIREDAFAKELAKIATMLAQISTEKPKSELVSTPIIPTVAAPAPGMRPDIQAADALLQQKMQDEAYDVYVCYHEEDEDKVLEIGEQLKAYGVLPWFDVIDLDPGGGSLQAQQQEKIQHIKSATVFVGKHGVVDWQATKSEALLNQFIKRKCPVIPVWLPDASKTLELPPFLATMVWVDFRKKVPNPLGQLLWGITRKRVQVA